MSFLSKVFGGSSKDQAPNASESIQKLRETEEMLMKKQDFLEEKIEQEKQTARKNASTNKTIALQALKRKKRYEKQLQQIDGTLSTIEMQREALESVNTNTAVLTTMKSAADTLKEAHKNMDVDKIHDMMDDIAEQQDVAREISNAISNPIAFGIELEIDGDELEKELEQLEQEELDKLFIEVENSTNNLPVPPVSEPIISDCRRNKKGNKEEHPDLKELEAWTS